MKNFRTNKWACEITKHKKNKQAKEGGKCL
jgi:hypothetical protein